MGRVRPRRLSPAAPESYALDMGRPRRFGSLLRAGCSVLGLLLDACSRTDPATRLAPSLAPAGSVRPAAASATPSGAASGGDASASAPHAARPPTAPEATAKVVEAKNAAALAGIAVGELFDVGPAAPM